ncbi:MAG: DUF4446 family protein [Candidatus Pacebacteria bacterium]|nr:DUF4446 family protein [Candidatus Paceibacterota bacterium]
MFKFSRKKKEEPRDIKEVLKEFGDLKEKFENLSEEIKNVKKRQTDSVQKVGLVRYNPFKEVGGDQSFSLALLDDNDSGAVVTSLYSREENRVYGKPVTRGESEYTLSIEEKKAIDKAKGINDEEKKKH